jgi:hypothetical protein
MTNRKPTQTTGPSGTLTLVLLAACLLLPIVARAQTADQIVAASLEATGGEEAIGRIETYSNTGRVKVESPLFGVLEGTLEAIRIPGRGYYESVDLGVITQQKGWDGERGWEQGPMGIRMLEGFELASIGMQSHVNLFVALRDRAPAGLRIERLEDEAVGDRPHYVLAVDGAGRPTTKVYVDRETSLLTRTTTTVVVPNLGEAPVVTDVADYEEVEGVMMSTSLTIEVEGISTTTVILDSTVVNTVVDESIFAVPDGTAARAATSAPAPPSSAVDAEALYVERCAMCHDGGAPRAAGRGALARLPADTVERRFRLRWTDRTGTGGGPAMSSTASRTSGWRGCRPPTCRA